MKKSIYLVMLLVLSACSADIAGQKTSFTIPAISNNQWSATAHPFKDGNTAYCVVEAGRNNIRLILEKQREDSQIKAFIESGRSMQPGTRFILTSSESNVRSYDKYLTIEQSQTIIDDLEAGRVVYLRWSEIHGGASGRKNFTNRVNPKDFITGYNKCLEFLKGQ